ncbi:helix-turn-helix transcriptional regulator [Brachybacterium fresconis]|uniref:Transcriptional regulator with XRE-family HTH domain n=1 Tax=Brachybacterium fresconis TaxID=173363 RepID=A0ABS4YHL8_9MICO|nr:helix-turn-helix transcriptional regulator [Brachybacterium fresconis]MBP2408263.1 transcriptional regulator with XRE-family HTH domain [Brachybacterium fresconis]
MEDNTRDHLADVRKNVTRYRKERELSQAELAELVTLEGFKFFPQTVQKIENGTRTIRLDEGMAIAKALGLAMSDLLRPVDSPVVELERAYRMALHGRESGHNGILDWLDGIAELKNITSLLGAEDLDIAEDDVNAWTFLVKETQRLLGESVQDLQRGAMRQMKREREERQKADGEEPELVTDSADLREKFGIGRDGRGVDPETS